MLLPLNLAACLRLLAFCLRFEKASFFCAPCALAQAEMEVKGRAEKAQHEKANGYAQPQGGMQYQPQQPNASQPHMQHQYSNGGSPAPMYHAPSKH